MMASEPYNVSDLEHELSPTFKQVYSNTAGIGISFYDASISFGEIRPGPSQTAPKIMDHVIVTMSWEHLKALYTSMGKIIGDFEESQGCKIRTPSALAPIIPKELSDG